MALIEKIGEKRAGGLLENPREPKAQKINSDSYPYVNTGSEAVDFSASRRVGVASAQEAKASVTPLAKSDEKDKSPEATKLQRQYRGQRQDSESPTNKVSTPSNASGESGSLNVTNSGSNSSDDTNSGNSLSDEAGIPSGEAINQGPVKLVTSEEVKKIRENLEKVVDLLGSWRMDDKVPTQIQDEQFKASSRPLSPQGEQSRSSQPASTQGEQSESPRSSEGSKVDLSGYLSGYFNTLAVVSSPSSTGSLDPNPTTGSPVNSSVGQVSGTNSSR